MAADTVRPRKRPGRGPPSVRAPCAIGFLFVFHFLLLSIIHLLPTLSLMPRRALPFLPKRKGSKRFASLRGLSAKSPTQAGLVKRGLRLWKQQPKQSPPFSKLSPTHQQTAALQLIGLAPIRQVSPLLNDSESCIFPFRQRARTGNAAHSMRSQAAR